MTPTAQRMPCFGARTYFAFTPVPPHSIGATAVMKASQKGHFETVFLLWNSGANVRTTDSYGQSAYDYAIGETVSAGSGHRTAPMTML